nr:MAG TPA: terminase small subunit [Caudoviricetes sp.]
MAYIDFPNSYKGVNDRKAFWLSPDGIILISQWRREGVPLEEIALTYIGVSAATLWRWTKQSSELVLALGISKDVTNGKVEQALLKRALGYEYDEVTRELVEGEMRTTKVICKHVSPDVKACLSWLFSRRPDRWRAIQDPIDTDAEAIGAAKRMMATIKEAAEEATENASVEQEDTDPPKSTDMEQS